MILRIATLFATCVLVACSEADHSVQAGAQSGTERVLSPEDRRAEQERIAEAKARAVEFSIAMKNQDRDAMAAVIWSPQQPYGWRLSARIMNWAKHEKKFVTESLPDPSKVFMQDGLIPGEIYFTPGKLAIQFKMTLKDDGEWWITHWFTDRRSDENIARKWKK